MTPDYATFNGHLSSTNETPLHAAPNERVRFYVVNAGPNLVVPFHLVGGIFDRAYVDGDMSQRLRNVQTTDVAPGGAAIFDAVPRGRGLRLREPRVRERREGRDRHAARRLCPRLDRSNCASSARVLEEGAQALLALGARAVRGDQLRRSSVVRGARASAFAVRAASGPAVRSSDSTASTAGSSSSANSWTSPIRSATSAAKRSPVTNQRRAAEADLRKRERGDHRRHDPELRLAEREHRRRLGDHDVRARDEPAAAAERVPLHTRDDRRRAAVDCVEHRAQPKRVGDVLLQGEVRRRAHPLHVGAGREGRSRRSARLRARRRRGNASVSSAITCASNALRRSGRANAMRTRRRHRSSARSRRRSLQPPPKLRRGFVASRLGADRPVSASREGIDMQRLATALAVAALAIAARALRQAGTRRIGGSERTDRLRAAVMGRSVLANANGHGLVALRKKRGWGSNNAQPVWSRDGRGIAFESTRRGETDLWSTRAPGRIVAPGAHVLARLRRRPELEPK